MIHDTGCCYAHLSIHRAVRHGCQCPAVVAAVRVYQRAAWERRMAKAGLRPAGDVDELDVEAAIISYASRGVPVPAPMTRAERRLIAEWLERRGTAADVVAHVTGITARSVVRRRRQVREQATV